MVQLSFSLPVGAEESDDDLAAAELEGALLSLLECLGLPVK